MTFDLQNFPWPFGLALLDLVAISAAITTISVVILVWYSLVERDPLALLAGLFFAFFVYAILPDSLPPVVKITILLATCLLALFLPDIWISNVAQRRQEVIRKALPDAFDLLVICAEAGLSLDASLDRVAKEMGTTCVALADELGLTAVELSFLPDRHKALAGLADRVPLAGLRALVNTLVQTERYGTPLADSLRVLSQEMRHERMMKAEEKGARLPALLTLPMVLFILPPLFVVLVGPAALTMIDSFAKM